jgi:hypothetical protein
MNDFHPRSPHDHFFRRTFDVVEHTRALLKAKLERQLLKKIRLDTLQPAKETFLSADEHEKRLDLLYSARFLDGAELLIYLLLEHKSEIDLSRESATFLPDAPELEARIRTLQLVRRKELEFESVVAIFRLLRAYQRIASHMDALADIMVYLATVFDAGKLIWFRQAVRSGLQIESETQMPSCYDAIVEEGRKKGRDEGLAKGRDEGLAKGLLIGRIRTLQEVLRRPVTTEDVLITLSLTDLQALASQLQESLANRPLHPGDG